MSSEVSPDFVYPSIEHELFHASAIRETRCLGTAPLHVGIILRWHEGGVDSLRRCAKAKIVHSRRCNEPYTRLDA